jgi:hypothetical protein
MVILVAMFGDYFANYTSQGNKLSLVPCVNRNLLNRLLDISENEILSPMVWGFYIFSEIFIDYFLNPKIALC